MIRIPFNSTTPSPFYFPFVHLLPVCSFKNRANRPPASRLKRPSVHFRLEFERISGLGTRLGDFSSEKRRHRIIPGRMSVDRFFSTGRERGWRESVAYNVFTRLCPSIPLWSSASIPASTIVFIQRSSLWKSPVPQTLLKHPSAMHMHARTVFDPSISHSNIETRLIVSRKGIISSSLVSGCIWAAKLAHWKVFFDNLIRLKKGILKYLIFAIYRERSSLFAIRRFLKTKHVVWGFKRKKYRKRGINFCLIKPDEKKVISIDRLDYRWKRNLPEKSVYWMSMRSLLQIDRRYYLGEGGRETRVESAILAKFRL